MVGVDISAQLLAHAEARAAAAGLGRIGWLRADAQTDPLPGGFDAAVSRFGVMFFDDPVAAFARIAAALRPGGRLVFVAWGLAEANPWFREAFRAAVERLGPSAPAGPNAPGPLAFADRARVLGLLRAVGLGDCAAEVRQVALHLPGGLATAVDLAGDVGPAKRLLREKGGTDADPGRRSPRTWPARWRATPPPTASGSRRRSTCSARGGSLRARTIRPRGRRPQPRGAP